MQKTGELLIREGLARKEDIDAALKIQTLESEADSKRNRRELPSFAEMPRNDRSPAAAAGESGGGPDLPSEGEKRTGRTIGRILCDLDLVSPIDLSRVLRKYQKQLRLGEILLREGVIDADQLEDVLYEQQLHLKPLGYMLVRKNRISIDQLYSALSAQYNIPYRPLEGFVINSAKTSDLTQIVGKNYAEENLIIPLSLEGTKLTLAVYMPEKMMNIHELRTVYSYLRMACVLIQPHKFQALFAELYGTSITAETTDMPEPAGVSLPEKKSEPKRVPSPEPLSHQTDSEASQIVNYLIKHAINSDATSIHIEQDFNGTTIRYRINGVLEALNLPWLENRLPQMTGAIVGALKTMAGVNENDTRSPHNGAFHVRFAAKENGQFLDFDVRLATCPTMDGENVTLRISDTRGTDLHLDDLQHSFQVSGPLKKVLDKAGGILLFSGPPGSGKQISLYAAASHLIRPEIKIVAIEETFRYSLPGIVQFQADPGRNLGTDTLLRMAPNHDPDVILLANMRDPETAAAVFDIAPAGPFILSGIIADDAVDTLFRLRAFGIRPSRIAQSLKAILAQRQVRKICSACKERYVPEPDEWQGLFTQYPTDVSFYRGTGCKSCQFTGYDGFLVISEFLTIDNDLATALERGVDPSALRQVAVESGFRTMAEDARLKLNRTTIEALLKTSARLFKGPETPGAADSTGPDPPVPPDGSKSIAFRQKTWTIAFLDSGSPVVDEMYETYRVLKEQTGSRPVANEIGLFHEFIAASFHHICRQYACSEVTFSIENKQGRPEVTASPVRTVQQDR